MRAVDLFAGCGGLSLGFQKAGIDVIAGFENWEPAIECYKANFKHPVFNIDLSDVKLAVSIISPLKPTIIIGGPPCQDYSSAGNRKEKKRAKLTYCYAQIITTIKPKYFVMENVDKAQKSKNYGKARKLFIKKGYALSEIVLDASLCGVPQKRKRFICFGVLGGQEKGLIPYLEKAFSKNEMTMRDYFGTSLKFQFYYRHPRNYNRKAIFSIDEPAPTMRGVNRPIPAGYKGNKNDACPINANIHQLTTKERAAIQTFPKDFVWIGNKTNQEQMIGNAVPVNLAKFIAEAIIKFDRDNFNKENKNDSFKQWLITKMNYSQRTTTDVVSRINRAENILKPSDKMDDFYLFLLEKQKDFEALSPSIKSQLKKAINLKSEFESSNLISNKN